MYCLIRQGKYTDSAYHKTPPHSHPTHNHPTIIILQQPPTLPKPLKHPTHTLSHKTPHSVIPTPAYTPPHTHHGAGVNLPDTLYHK